MPTKPPGPCLMLFTPGPALAPLKPSSLTGPTRTRLTRTRHPSPPTDWASVVFSAPRPALPLPASSYFQEIRKVSILEQSMLSTGYWFSSSLCCLCLERDISFLYEMLFLYWYTSYKTEFDAWWMYKIQLIIVSIKHHAHNNHPIFQKSEVTGVSCDLHSHASLFFSETSVMTQTSVHLINEEIL